MIDSQVKLDKPKCYLYLSEFGTVIYAFVPSRLEYCNTVYIAINPAQLRNIVSILKHTKKNEMVKSGNGQNWTS